MHLRWTPHLIAAVALLCSGGAAALGFGAIRSSVVLGQALNLAVPVSLADGETLSSECASAEVLAGDNRLPSSAVLIRVTQGRDATEAVLRVSTTSVVEEPVLTVTVNAGCPTRLSRTLVLLADPPLVTTADAPAASPSLATVTPPASTAPAPVESRPAPARSTRPAAPARSTRSAPSRPARTAVASAAPSASAVARAPAAVAPRPTARAEAKPRLQLDSGQVSLSDTTPI